MTFDVDDVIAAPASTAGASARGIIRLSGTYSQLATETVFEPRDQVRWRNSKIASRFLGQVSTKDYRTAVASFAYLWPTTRSYTGQPLVELHLPGSPMLLDVVLAELLRGGVRPARPGEFTLRAFLAGRLDLSQAEAVLGVIDASDHVELNLALRQLAGGISNRLVGVRSDLLGLLADLEAGLDFVEEDIQFVRREDVLTRVRTAKNTVQEMLSDASTRWRDSHRYRVVLAGLPNAGKSTLFNAIVGNERAMVSPKAGTTRDWLTTEISISGLEIELIDTAGWEKSHDDLSRAMQFLRGEQLDRADLIIWCLPADATSEERQIDQSLRQQVPQVENKLLFLLTKCDLESQLSSVNCAPELRVSAKTEQGLSKLQSRISEELSRYRFGARQMLGSTAARSRQSLQAAANALERSLEAAEDGFGDEIIAAELRLALEGLASVVGAIYSDDVLDIIFSRFCIGK